MQIIFHIDLNAFFASAEISKHPHLQGKPLVIGRDSRRGIVSTASYEARAYGIHSAMPIYKAKELCPQLLIVEPHFELYKELSVKFFDIIARYTSLIEIASIDECYCDMTDYILKNNISPIKAAKNIQYSVLNELKLKCSIGIAPNKFLAKMGSDLKKPLGITQITNSNYKEILWPIPIGDMYGVGKKTVPKLTSQGIQTIGDLAKYENYEKIRNIFGKNTLLFYQRANGKDFSKVNPHRGQLKSISHSTTFEHDTNDEIFIKDKLKQLTLDLSNKAKKKQLITNSISLTLKMSRTETKTKQILLDDYTNDESIIYANVLLLFEKFYRGEMLRLIGIGLNNIIKERDLVKQISLFDSSHHSSSNNQTDLIIKQLNAINPQAQFIKASNLIKKQNTE